MQTDHEVEEVEHEAPQRAVLASAPCRMTPAHWHLEVKLLKELLHEVPRSSVRGAERLQALGDVMQRLHEHAEAVHRANLQALAPDVGAQEARRRLAEQRAQRNGKAR